MQSRIHASFPPFLHLFRGPAFSTGCLLIALALQGCNKEEKKELSAQEKQERVEALLKASGAEVPAKDGDPAPKGPSPSAAPSPAATPTSATPEKPTEPTAGTSAADAAPENPASGAPPEVRERTQIRLIDAGSGPKKALSYSFVAGRERKFSMDLEIAPSRMVNGQDTPGMPPMALSVTGTTRTERVTSKLAERSYTFTAIAPSVAGIPPEIAEQMKTQFQGLSGLQLVEKVTPWGQVEDLALKQSAMNPQVLALMQYLTDGMTNAFLPLPEAPIGQGAKWVATTTVESAGLRVTQENTIVVRALQGEVLTVELSYVQSAPSQEVKSPDLPAGVKVEIVKLDGSGTGRMTTDLKNFVVDSKIDVAMQVDTKITQPGAAMPITESGLTKMRAQIRVTP